MGALIDTMSQMSSENQMFFFAFSHLLGSTIRTSIYSQLIKKTNYLRSIFCLGAKWKTSSWMRTRRMFKISTFGRIFYFRARCFLCAWEENWIELYDSNNLRSNCYVPTSSSIQFESQWNQERIKDNNNDTNNNKNAFDLGISFIWFDSVLVSVRLFPHSFHFIAMQFAQ